MNIQIEIQKIISTYGRDIIKERRLVYILSDYGILKDLRAERRILLDIIDEGYAEQMIMLQPDRQDNSLKICSFISEVHQKTGFQVQKLITVFKWLSDSLGIVTVPFESILHVEEEAPIKEIIIKGKYKVKDPRAIDKVYKLPVDSFSKSSSKTTGVKDSKGMILERAAAKAAEEHIKYVLSEFKVDTADIDFSETPSMYYAVITLASNIRITKLIYLKDTIAEAISPTGCRIIAPIPGTNKIGIELIKEQPMAPSFQSILPKEKPKDSFYCSLGLMADGSPLSIDLSKVGHALIGGQPTSGKTNSLNTIIYSLISCYFPYEFKLALFDLKGAGLNISESIQKNYLVEFGESSKIANTTASAGQLLFGLTQELTLRKSLFLNASCNNIDEYNTLYLSGDLDPSEGHSFTPRIIIIIDELADIMDLAIYQSTMKYILSEGAQYGFHIVASTSQNIRRNMLTEEMKKAFQARISFKLESSIESKSVLGSSDAVGLYTIGDALFYDPTTASIKHFSTPYVDKNTKDLITQYISTHPIIESYRIKADSIDLPEKQPKLHSFSGNDIDTNAIIQAVSILLQGGKCNEATLQKTMSCTFNIAHQILLKLDEYGITLKEKNVRTLIVKDLAEAESKM